MPYINAVEREECCSSCQDIQHVIVLCCCSYYWFNPLVYIFVYINSLPCVPPRLCTHSAFPFPIPFFHCSGLRTSRCPSSLPHHSAVLWPRAVSPIPAATMFSPQCYTLTVYWVSRESPAFQKCIACQFLSINCIVTLGRCKESLLNQCH